MSWYQKGKTNLDFTGARDSEWQWNQLDHMQVCTLLQIDNHASTHHSVFYRPDALPAAQPIVSKYSRLKLQLHKKRKSEIPHNASFRVSLGADCMPLHPKTQSSLASFKSRLVFPF